MKDRLPLLRLVRTLRPLRARQWVAQSRHALRGVGSPVVWDRPGPLFSDTGAAASFLEPPAHARVEPGPTIRLIGASLDAHPEIDWGWTEDGPLFAYHLHQFDFARDPSLSPSQRLAWMLDWIRRHDSGVGWDPHPLGLRILSWGKLLLSPGALPEDPEGRAEVARSLARQIETLSKNLEIRLQANHLLSNLIGVVFGGFLFQGPDAERWRGFWSHLRDEMDRQIHGDGLHEERAPMYHALLLENLLDLLNLVQAAEGPLPDAMSECLQSVTSRMIVALETVAHPDGDIALFSDSAFGIAHRPETLRAYADSLAVSPASSRALLPDGGYARLVAGGFTLIASVAGPAPAHQPGHAHCDALAFELSYGDQRIVTDTGVFEYVPGERRRLARATASHSTLEIAGEEQAEIWSAHRVGGRPQVHLDRTEPERLVVASCRGWSTSETLHQRHFMAGDEAIEIRDMLQGRRLPVRLHLPLAPGLEPRLSHDQDGGTEAHLRLADGTWLRIALPVAADWKIIRTPYYPSFGCEQERACLMGEASNFDSGTFRFEIVG